MNQSSNQVELFEPEFELVAEPAKARDRAAAVAAPVQFAMIMSDGNQDVLFDDRDLEVAA